MSIALYCYLVLLFVIVTFNIYIINENKYINFISNITINTTLLNEESKYGKLTNNGDIILPKIIDFKEMNNIKLTYSPLIVIAVLSSPHNFKKRFSFRYKSRSKCNYKTGCIFIFFIGYSIYQNQELLKRELRIYNDVIQFSFQNSYLNVTLLSIMALRFCYKMFKNIKFLIKTDDDVLVNYKLIYRILKIIDYRSNNVYGHYSKKSAVNRNNKSISYLPYEAYPYTNLPEYVFGCLIIITYSSLARIYEATNYPQYYIWMEDVNLGVLCSICKIKVKQFPLNIDLYTKKRKCNLNNKSIAIEIYNSIDSFYCISYSNNMLNV